MRFVPVPYAVRLGSSKIRPVADFFNFVQLICRTGMYFAPLRALANALLEQGGLLPRRAAGGMIEALDGAARHRLRKIGMTIGTLDVFAPALLKPRH